MRQGVIITAIGKDRPGIVDRLSGIIYREGCNLEDSRMAILAGEFAFIVLVTGPESAVTKLKDSLPSFAEDADLTLQVRTTHLEEVPREPVEEFLPYEIHVVAMDHPGIVHRVSNVLASKGINVAALDTRVTNAPTTGTPIFALNIEAQIPVKLSIAELRADLEQVADEENLDLEFRAVR